MEISEKQFTLLCLYYIMPDLDVRDLDKFFEKAKILDLGYEAFLKLNQSNRNYMHCFFDHKGLTKPEIMKKNPEFYYE
jgi:hypothetical protein